MFDHFARRCNSALDESSVRVADSKVDADDSETAIWARVCEAQAREAEEQAVKQNAFMRRKNAFTDEVRRYVSIHLDLHIQLLVSCILSAHRYGHMF